MTQLRKLLIVVAVLAAALSAAVAASGAPRTAAACQTAWGTGTKSVAGMHTAGLLQTRTGRHACYDRVVFEFAGTATGYRVGYSANVFTPAQGAGLRGYTAGAALLSVQLRDPAYGANGATYHRFVGAHVANVFGFRSLRDVVYGGSFEGDTTFAVGVRAHLPFRVFHLTGPGAHHRIVLDIAH